MRPALLCFALALSCDERPTLPDGGVIVYYHQPVLLVPCWCPSDAGPVDEAWTSGLQMRGTW